jgi:hypothetical protein
LLALTASPHPPFLEPAIFTDPINNLHSFGFQSLRRL